MTMQELREKLQKEIDELKEKYNAVSENDYLEKGIILGKINGLLTASILSFGEI